MIIERGTFYLAQIFVNALSPGALYGVSTRLFFFFFLFFSLCHSSSGADARDMIKGKEG